ncbi:MAG: TenA family protein [Candidatus Adiutrix sp.]|jgi:thiaminase/transcriptional activator TenA|nr:TenA family protein [Candidatus Adiutrix sp.]
METTWSRTVWQSIEPVFSQITTHPFLTGLMAGSLELEKFLFYLGQDALYLDDFGKVLAGIAVKNPHRDQVEDFLSFAADTINVERALHRSFLGQMKSEVEASPACLLYTSFMHRQLALAPVEVAVATVLPCFWVYKEVGDFILAGEKTSANPYQTWIDTYGGEEYAGAVARAIGAADRLAAGTTAGIRGQMTAAFMLCTRMEWMFWDSAWRLESWPV